MSSQTHRIELQARDGTKQAFDSIKRSALEDARALEQMGKTGSRALGEVEQSANDTAKGMRDLQVGLAALGAGFALASRAAADQTRQIDAINRLYGESADEIIALSEAIQDNTNFSNDAARQAAITGSTLAQNYALSAEQIGVLIERSADLAQIHGVDLADAMSRVSGAIRGEGEAAELLGLNMSDAAVAAEAAARGLEGWNTTMSEAEKAAFRYTLVLEQTTETQGAASEAADSTAGKVRQLAHEVQDAAQQFAAWTGPVGESVAVLSDYALQTGIALAGVTKLATGLRELGAASRIASLAMGPAGLVLAAGAAAVALGLLLTRTSELEQVQRASASATDDLANQLATLNATGSTAARDFEKVKNVFGELLLIQEDLQRMQAAGGGQTAGADAMSADEINDIKDAIIELFSNPFVDSGKVTSRLRELFAQFREGEIDSDGLRDAIVDAAEAWSQFAAEEQRVAATTNQVGVSIKDQTAALEASEAVIERTSGRWQEYDEAVRAARVADIEKARANQELIESMSVQANAEADRLERNQQKWNEYDAAVRAANDSRVQSTRAAQAYLDALERERALVEASAGMIDTAADATAGLGDSQTELSSALDAANGALQEQAASIAGWEGPVRTGIRALQEFKDIQDGIISQQDVFNQQYSEYGSQITAIERAVTVLQERQANGIALTQEEIEFLDSHTAALARLEGGQDDAAVSAGILAAQYGENMSRGDELNRTLDGVAGATEGLSGSVDRLTIALIALSAIQATPSVSVAGLAEANAELGVVMARMIALDGAVANATVNVGANIAPGLGGLAGLFEGGGLVGAATGRMVRVNEGGPETATLPTGDNVWLPTGSMVWPHAASVMGNRGGGGRPVTFYGPVTIVANDPNGFYDQLHSYSMGGR